MNLHTLPIGIMEGLFCQCLKSKPFYCSLLPLAMVVTVGIKNKDCGWIDLMIIVLIKYFVWLNWTSIIQYSWPWTAHADPALCISAANGNLVHKTFNVSGNFSLYIASCTILYYMEYSTSQGFVDFDSCGYIAIFIPELSGWKRKHMYIDLLLYCSYNTAYVATTRL